MATVQRQVLKSRKCKSGITWKINDSDSDKILSKMKECKPGEMFRSPTVTLFNIPMVLNLYPNGLNMSRFGNLECFVIPLLKSNEMKELSFNTRLLINECPPHLSPKIMHRMNIKILITKYNVGEFQCNYKQSDIINLTTLTMKAEIELFDIISIYGSIKSLWLKNGDNALNVKRKEIENGHNKENLVRMNEFKKYKSAMFDWGKDLGQRVAKITKKLKNIENRMERMEQEINKKNGIKIDGDKQKLRDWFINNVKLPQYFHIFIENGIENMDILLLIGSNELNDMNITKIGHKMQILNQIAKLNEINNNNNNHIGIKRANIDDTFDFNGNFNVETPPKKKRRPSPYNEESK